MSTLHKLPLKPFKMQREVLECQHDTILLRIGRRGSKSKMLLMKTLEIAFDFDNWIAKRGFPGTQISLTSPQIVLVVAPTRDMVKRIHFLPMLALIETQPALKALVKHINRSTQTITLKGNRPSIVYTSLGVSGEAENVRGSRLIAALVDELQAFRWEAIDSVIKTALLDSPGSQLICGGTPAGKGLNAMWLLHKMAEQSPDKIKEFHFSTLDNPHISRKAIAEEQELKSLAVWKREMMAEFTDFPAVIYPGLTDSIFAELPTTKAAQSYLSLDFGSQNCALICLQLIDGLP